MNYPPHITLAVYDDVDRTTLFKAYHRATEQYEALSIQFSAMRYFESPASLIVWASPQVEVDHHQGQVLAAFSSLLHMDGPGDSQQRTAHGEGGNANASQEQVQTGGSLQYKRKLSVVAITPATVPRTQ